MSELHPIRVVSRRTGLSPHVIRAWERRYKALTPGRTSTNRRVYTKEDIERLALLRRSTLLGRSIGQIANIPTDALRQLVEQEDVPQLLSNSRFGEPTPSTVESCMRAIERLDAKGLVGALEEASVSMSKPALVERVISPLLERIGDRWRDGSLRLASEHLASATLRTFLGNMNRSFPLASDAPRLLVTTPDGQLHELGALMAGTAAAAEGWQVAYLGPSLPAEDIAAAAETNRSRAVALSIVLAGEGGVKNELERIGQLLPHRVALLVGGRGAIHYHGVLRRVGGVHLADLKSFRLELESLRYVPKIRMVS